MRLEYTVTLADYKEALRLHFRNSLLSRASWFVFLWIIPALGLALFALLIYLTATGSPPADSSGYTTSLMMISSAFVMRFFRSWGMKKHFQQMFPADQKNHQCYLEITPEFLISGIEGTSEGRFFWSAISRYLHNERVVMLYLAEKRFLFLPMTAFSVGSLATLESYLSPTTKKD